MTLPSVVPMFVQAFPIVIIDEDFDARHAAGRAVRQLADALGERGFRVVTGVGYQEARRLARIYHNESSLLISVDSAEAATGQWAALEDLLAVTRRRNTKLPIFLLGDERTAESIPTDVLKHTQAFFRLHEDSPDSLARAIGRSAQLYVETLLPPLFKALSEYTLRTSDVWPPPGHGGGVAFRKSPVGRVFYDFFGENMVRADLSKPVPELGTPVSLVGATAAAQRNAARIFGSDHTLFVPSGTAAANRIAWNSLVSRDDLVLVDRNCDASILHALIMTGAVPIYLQPSRNSFGLTGPVSRDQLTPLAVQQRVSAAQTGSAARVRGRLLALTNSTRDGICYNVATIKSTLGDAVDVMHFDERWLAYANFHEFYAGHYAMSSTLPRRGHHALTCATHSTHTMLAALSPGSMLHLLDGDAKRVDVARFHDALAMHTAPSPQYGVLASCDVAAAMMEQPAGRAIVEETIDEALAFRRALAAVKRTSGAPWWFTLWQPPALAEYPVADPARWRLSPGDRWHGFGSAIPEDVLLDPIKVTLLTPGHRPGEHTAGIPAAVVTAFLAAQRIEVQRTGPYAFLVLFSVGITEGRWSSLITELMNFRDLYERNAPIREVLPQLAAEHSRVYGAIGLKDLCAKVDIGCARFIGRPEDDPFTRLPEIALRPADAHDRLVRGDVEPVEITQLMNRTVATAIVPTTPGMPLLMPGERITSETAVIQGYLRRAQDFDAECPGLENAVQGVRVDQDGPKRRYVVDCLRE